MYPQISSTKDLAPSTSTGDPTWSDILSTDRSPLVGLEYYTTGSSKDTHLSQSQSESTSSPLQGSEEVDFNL